MTLSSTEVQACLASLISQFAGSGEVAPAGKTRYWHQHSSVAAYLLLEMVWQEMERWAMLVIGLDWTQVLMPQPGMDWVHQQEMQGTAGMVGCLHKIGHTAHS
ncbi:hypothetical protein ABBQ38_009326 [Trebouxia sp. C0009 RCD-2024]